ncbi:MAG: hypothetical protein JNL74_16850, partial [Fibrobacteres bacterium]|nr:hypothetical protein [Fibrobacterota bacterium]
MKRLTLILTLWLAALLPAAVTFVSSPKLTTDGTNKLFAEFAVSESTDVEVSIIDLRDSAIIRHLAAGRLGGNAPAPLAKGTLTQKIEWDGKDDFGFAVSAPEQMKVRVRAGMGVAFKQYAGVNPYLSANNEGIFGLVKGAGNTMY